MNNLHIVLGVLDYIKSLHSKALKLEELKKQLDNPDIVLALNLLVSGQIRQPVVRFNSLQSVSVLQELSQLTTNGSKGIPMDTLKLAVYLSKPLSLGITSFAVYSLLDDTDNLIDTHSLLQAEAATVCLICAESVDAIATLCEHCMDSLTSFEDFRSEDRFTTQLSYKNFARPVTLTEDSTYSVVLNNYKVDIRGVQLTFQRIKSFQAQLPFVEYQKILVA